MDPRKLTITVSLFISVIMLAGKVTAYVLSGSMAILSDAAESVVHGAATGLAAFSLWYSEKPADATHPYGHGRIAYFSAGFEGALVLAASIAILTSGVAGMIQGPQLRRLGVGLLISAALAVINLVLGLTLVAVGRKHHSLILTANGKHVLSDMWTTSAAILGVGLVMLTDREWLDPLAALLIGLYIMATGVSLLRGSFIGLMDQVDPELSQRLIAGLQAQVRSGPIVDFHQLRCRRLNDEIWVDVHLLVPGDLPTIEAHARITQVEDSIRRLFPDDTVHVMTHVEPSDHEKAHPGGHRLGDPLAEVAVRQAPAAEEPPKMR